MTNQDLDERAEKTLRDTDSYRVPVPIHLVAQRLNLTMEAGSFGKDISGMLIIRGDQGAIGYNSAHARVRQRFTIAHEIAHFLLHSKSSGKPQLFLDSYLSFRRGATGPHKAHLQAGWLRSPVNVATVLKGESSELCLQIVGRKPDCRPSR
jgi:hypothetical protein